MPMRVHGLAFVGILVAQAHVFYRLPLPCESFKISVPFGVKAMLLD